MQRMGKEVREQAVLSVCSEAYIQFCRLVNVEEEIAWWEIDK